MSPQVRVTVSATEFQMDTVTEMKVVREPFLQLFYCLHLEIQLHRL